MISRTLLISTFLFCSLAKAQPSTDNHEIRIRAGDQVLRVDDEDKSPKIIIPKVIGDQKPQAPRAKGTRYACKNSPRVKQLHSAWSPSSGCFHINDDGHIKVHERAKATKYYEVRGNSLKVICESRDGKSRPIYKFTLNDERRIQSLVTEPDGPDLEFTYANGSCFDDSEISPTAAVQIGIPSTPQGGAPDGDQDGAGFRELDPKY